MLKAELETIYSNGNLIKNVLAFKPIRSVNEPLFSSWNWQNYHMFVNSNDK